jgi:hypothetical protein
MKGLEVFDVLSPHDVASALAAIDDGRVRGRVEY